MNPVMFSIGSFSIYWYSFFILLAFSLGFILANKEIKRHKDIPNNFLYDYFFYLIPVVILGARLYYVLFEFNYYKNDLLEIFKVWNGGLAIHGGVIVGIIYTCIYTKKHKVNTYRFIDIAAPSLVLGQAIGRWGNFFNQEAYGPVVSLSFLKSIHIPKFIIDGMYIDGVYHHPTFLYESLTCLICFMILIILRKYYKNLKLGLLCGIYFTIYGVERFLVESLRQDSLMLGSIKVAQLVSIIMVIVGIAFICLSFIKKVPYIEIENKKPKKGKRNKHE